MLWNFSLFKLSNITCISCKVRYEVMILIWTSCLEICYCKYENDIKFLYTFLLLPGTGKWFPRGFIYCTLVHYDSIPAQKMKFFINGSFQQTWPNPQLLANLFTCSEEILNKKLHFLCTLFSDERRSWILS